MTSNNASDSPRSTVSQDLHAIFGVAFYGLCNPAELWTSTGPTLSELTGGLLGQSFRPERDIADLSGKTVFITGGNTGLGKETVLQLARHNPARIYLAARNEAKAVEAIRSIREELSPSSSTATTVDIQYTRLDLADFSSIRQAAAQFTQDNSRLDILILNAGILAEAAVTTPQGHEIQLGTNHIGHFLLTKLLLPVLEKTANQDEEETADVRVITLTSLASGLTPSSLSSSSSSSPTNNEQEEEADFITTISSTPRLLSLTTWQRYAISKAANILFATELARRHPSLTSVSVHPGLVASDLYNPTQATNKLASYVLPLSMKVVFRSVRSGTLNQLWAAAGARKEQIVNGAYYTPVGYRNEANRFVVDERLARRLWEWTDEVTNA
ncbi:hypothetical protein UA08_02886 [Talaromyces atroroseus]|uniref:Uncharacterized protein n=1 Tax=Talaromyces atroroseus TaxID=1441469 RepID=A0A225B2K7_TALAT|nr:hypothetical protein UA08_02886 [Talaromyces atroroseus]OKL62219.1 hypothetical protein UA08_02886 [Talaromyces atroroseus]